MAADSIPFLEKQRLSLLASSNNLVTTATQNNDRRQVPMLDRDVYRNISSYGRRVLQSLGRYLTLNVPQVRGAVLEQATLATAGIMSQFYGSNQNFKNIAEDWIIEHNRICDVRGRPFTIQTLYRNLALALWRDGEMGVLFTEGAGGYPMLQVIPSHRIGSPEGTIIIEDGPFKGSKLRDGVILNDYGRAMGYRILLGDTPDYANYLDVSANDMDLCFIPEFPEQLRGFSPVGLGAFDWQDIADARRFELMAQKILSAIALIEVNEDGEPAPGADLGPIIIPGADETTTATPSSLVSEVFDGGLVRYLRARSGADLKTLESNRPSLNRREFEDQVVRADMHGLGWSMDYSLDPSKVGGAPMRVIVDKINRMVGAVREFGIEPLARRIDGWRVAKAIKLGLIPTDPEWFKWEHQFAADITADKKYDSDVDVQEMRAGLQCPQDAIGRRGGYWEDVQDKTIAFRKRFEKRCKEEGIDPDKVIWPTPNGAPPAPEPPLTDRVPSPRDN